MKFDVVGIDNPCMDFIINLNSFPDQNSSERVLDISLQGGGKVSSGLIAAARLGVSCAILGTVGTDKYGELCREDFIYHGIDISGLLSRKNASTNFDIVISNREKMGRSILYNPGSAENLTVLELDNDYLQSTKFLYIASINDLTKKAIEIVKSSGGKVFLDADHYESTMESSLSELDFFIGSEFCYISMFGDKAHKEYSDFEANCCKIRKKGPETVIFTFGEKGCLGLSDEGFFNLPAYHVDVVDTVGAGDIYHGAFIAGLVKGWSIKEIAQFSSAVSAIKCTRIGGRAGIPDEQTTKIFMETGKIDYTEIDKRVAFYRRKI